MKPLTLAAMLAVLAATPLVGQAEDVADDIVKLSEDTYVIRRNEQPIYRAGSFTRQKRRIVEDAEAFAAQQGKAVEEISFDEEEHLINEFYGPHSWEYQFRLVDPPAGRTAAPAAAPAAVAAAPTTTANPPAAATTASPAPATGQAAATTAPVAAVPAAAAPAKAAGGNPGSAAAGSATNRDKPGVDEIYDQLTKLDELRKKGILSDEEFETLKQRVLAAD